jgi:putative ABC transport system permease protein
MDLRLVAPTGMPLPAAGIVLNDWTARELSARPGDSITLDYYVWEDPGRLVTRSASFQVSAVVPIAGLAADRELAPVYPGISDAKSLAEWDPPFPVDLHRVRRIDEDYWDKYRTTPKAFISLDAGQRLWGSRYGNETSVRMPVPAGETAAAARDRLTDALRRRLDPLAAGMLARDVRSEGLAASRGATDFGEYFTYFSFFLVVSALLLAALFFRLGLEQRAREIGLLRSAGFPPAAVGRLFVAEASALAAVGAAIGIAGALGYGRLMAYGLRTWWAGAVGTSALTLHARPLSLVIGAVSVYVAAIACIWWTLHSFMRISERALLAGQIAADEPQRPSRLRRLRRPLAGGVAAIVVAAALLGASAEGLLDATGGFFAAGAALLIGCVCLIAYSFGRRPSHTFRGHGWWPAWRLGVRSAAQRPGRSVLAIAVIASAVFILISVDAFRQQGPPPQDRHSGVGGYPLLVDLLVPIVHDPNGADGRTDLGLPDGSKVSIEPFRVLPGDDASCLNLYEPTSPRMLGVRQAFIDQGRFAFQSSLAESDRERANPWLLLNRNLGDATPVIADANSMTYVLHKQLGDTIVVKRGDRELRLRLVAALADSIFQSELLMADQQFLKLFPEEEGFRFLLVDVAEPQRAAEVSNAIEKGAADLGADATSTVERLAAFHTVENTYISTFQALGGLGLLVGTIGLAAVVLRNVLERRRELALLGAVGYAPAHITAMVLGENLLLLGWGVVVGAVCALVAIAPAAIDRGAHLPAWTSGALLVAAVFAAGLLSSVAAARAALRARLLEALRAE